MTKTDLKPYVARVRHRITVNPDSPVWPKMEARWAALVREAEARIRSYHGGTASPRQNIQASEEVVRLATQVEASEIMTTVAAMYLMLTVDPHWFKSDSAFDIQLVRRVRGLSEASIVAYRDPNTGKARRVYVALPPRAATVLASWLGEAVGVLGLHIARVERQEQEARRQETEDLDAALMALK